MKRSVVVLAALVAIVGLAVVGYTVLIKEDSTMTTDTSSKVTDGQLRSAADTRVFFGHQSVGGNVISGIPAVYAGQDVQPPEIIESRSAVPGDAFFQHANIGANTDPRSKMDDFRSILASGVGDDVDVAFMKFCYIDITADTDVPALFEQYRAMMTDLERTYPDVSFLYVTTPVTTQPSWKGSVKALLGRSDGMGDVENAARERFNALLRAEYGSTGRVFDLAAVESTAPDGSRVRGTADGEQYYAMYPGYAADPGHLNAVGSEIAAAELLRVIAGTREAG